MLNMARDHGFLRKKSTIRESMGKDAANANMINIITSSLPNFSCYVLLFKRVATHQVLLAIWSYRPHIKVWLFSSDDLKVSCWQSRVSLHTYVNLWPARLLDLKP